MFHLGGLTRAKQGNQAVLAKLSELAWKLKGPARRKDAETL